MVIGGPHGFNESIIAPRHRFQTFTQLIDGLMMDTVHINHAVEDL